MDLIPLPGFGLAASLSASERRTAFSLLELMVSIGIILILIGVALPTLRFARQRAQQIGTLADLRSVGLTVESYTQARKDHFPFVPIAEPFVFPPGENQGSMWTDDPWAARYAWPTVMHDIAPWAEHYQTWLTPAARHDGDIPWRPQNGPSPLWPSFAYSNSFIAAARVWTPGGAPTLGDVSPRRVAELANPSSKVLMFDAAPGWTRGTNSASGTDDRRAVLIADGAAAEKSDSEAVAPFPNPLRSDSTWLYHDTPGGLQGRDLR